MFKGLKEQAIHENKIKVQACAGKITTNVFWDSQGTLFAEFLKTGATMMSERYVQTFKKLNKKFEGLG